MCNLTSSTSDSKTFFDKVSYWNTKKNCHKAIYPIQTENDRRAFINLAYFL